MDYIGTIPVFISLTNKISKKEQIKTGIQASLIACLIILFFSLGGKSIMDYFGLSIASLKIGGGLLLLYFSFEMIFSGQFFYEKSYSQNITVSPLAIPMLAGPASMSFAMISFVEAANNEKLLIPIAILIVSIIGSVTLAFSSLINQILGKEFIRALEKLTAIILSVIASQMILDGIKLFFF